jgi:hypothetical protein
MCIELFCLKHVESCILTDFPPFLWLWRYTGQKVAKKMLISILMFIYNLVKRVIGQVKPIN